VLDLFAGTGNLGIEALSRGARCVLFVDKAREAVRIIEENLTRTKLSQKGQIWCAPARSAIARMDREKRLFDLVFLDPPYGFQHIGKTILALVQARLLSPAGLVVVEHHRNDNIPEQIAQLRKVFERRFGDTEVTLFQEKSHA
jgi:16S rRNA (guanine(966)-N(2))-methyltransferase RsmD